MGTSGNHLQLGMDQDVVCRWESEMTHIERIRIINQYRHQPFYLSPPDVTSNMYVWLTNAMWLAVTNPNACKQDIVQKSHRMTRGVLIK